MLVSNLVFISLAMKLNFLILVPSKFGKVRAQRPGVRKKGGGTILAQRARMPPPTPHLWAQTLATLGSSIKHKIFEVEFLQISPIILIYFAFKSSEPIFPITSFNSSSLAAYDNFPQKWTFRLYGNTYIRVHPNSVKRVGHNFTYPLFGVALKVTFSFVPNNCEKAGANHKGSNYSPFVEM